MHIFKHNFILTLVFVINNPYVFFFLLVILRDVEFHDLKMVVEYMYKGEVSITQNQLAPILRAADLLKVRGLDEMVKAPSYDEESKLDDSMRPHKKRRFTPDSLELLPKRVLKTRDDLFDDGPR